MTKTARQWAACLRILCAVALVFVGFAHKPVTAAMLSPVELAAFVLPDGTIPDICLSDVVDGDIKGGKKHTSGHGCEACRIGGSMLSPEPVDLIGAVLAFRIVGAKPLVEAVIAGTRFQPGAPPRAPPVFLV